MYKINWQQTGKESKQSVLTRRGKRGGGIIWCKQCSFLVNFRLKYKDMNKSNKRQTYTDYMGVLGEKCSPKWGNFTLKQGENLKKICVEFSFRNDFHSGWRNFQLREHLLLVDDAISRVPTLFCPRNSRSFQGVFKGFLNFFKVSLNIPNELRDSPNQSLNINWTGIAYYILST